MIELAIKAGLPMVHVTTDDPNSVDEVLQSIAGLEVQEVESLTGMVMHKKGTLLMTTNAKLATAASLASLEKYDKTLIFVNTEKNSLMFSAGQLLPPKKLLLGRLSEFTAEDLTPVLSGLSLKKAIEVCRLASAKFGKLDTGSIKAMRAMLGEPMRGVYPVETTMEFYQPYPGLKNWLDLNGAYFLSKTVKPALRPRGVLLDGPPGTGKSMAAKFIANTLKVPLFRLDIGTSMARFVGESEATMMHNLLQLESMGPCVALLDEVEKVFVQDSDGGVLSRMMSQLLWWLAEHKAQVLTVMTTNNRSKIPPELYRKGRVDEVMDIPQLSATEAQSLAVAYLTTLMSPKKPSLKQITSIKFPSGAQYSHVEVINHVLHTVKVEGWCN